MRNKMKPIHPGDILKDELDELELSASAFAKQLSVPVNRVTYIINGKRAITADTALRLARFFGTSPEFWLNLQTSYDLKMTMEEKGQKIMKEVHPHSEAALFTTNATDLSERRAF